MQLTSLVYLERDERFLMLHRIKKAHDINQGKWVGIGGKFELGEAPLECAKREVKEETGWELEAAEFRGVVTFIYADDEPMYIFVYTGTLASDEVRENDEGVMAWIPKDEVLDLPLWEGDRLFLEPLMTSNDLFDIKVVYDENSQLLAYEDNRQ
ncbi:NUDIX hydrolase [Aerococcus urinae]|uniref:8-oxo-dGTP diphosphatase n=1 Tax=Aerococcus urinae TaxID=1376 RepID=A0A0X8FDG2_9LACT|nr:8-oxo-dGTP diphosphatase [Aerococcus urinae]AMB95313.1 DNA mismatch repair protein MutT [Aerococcus urinae]MCY3032037.1 8-oxo-dGTP diphosphatase [Aerococcus urinae]MCY3036971.1 8-oxo-dGTP diphosphatase [Aerococcus urinae]MCY3044083.1 8-oxo-dGTP diphosphatase [Aerococcus urinae]MCY3046884.1 8-oxo-dGTP diphosphatase [Aerococcus urinae]